MTLIYVRRKSDYKVTEVSTQELGRDEDYVGLSFQPLWKHKGEKYEVPANFIDWEIVEAEESELQSSWDGIESLRSKYLEVIGKPVPNLKKNDAEWIKSKLLD